MPKVQKGNIYTKSYTNEQLEKAVVAIKQGMPKRRAAIKFGVPRTTLQFRLGHKFSKTTHGPATILTNEEENILVDWIFQSCRKGFPPRKEDVQVSAKQFLDKNPRENPFKNNLPGDGWYRAFLRRHNNVNLKTSEAVTSASSNVPENNVREWFQKIQEYLTAENYSHILNDPQRIFNVDETGFQLCLKNKRVLAPKGFRNVSEADVGRAKSNVTVLFTFSASGLTTPPMIVYPYQRLPKEILNSIPDSSWCIEHSDSGWMKSELFYEYLENVIYPHLKKLNVTFPIILFLDGHKSHLDKNLSDLCMKLGIVLIALHPNATRILQPADLSAFKPIKEGWKRAVLEWQRENPTLEVTKQYFAPILQRVIQNFEQLKKDIVKNGFRACGLHPWNADAIDFSKCLGKRQEQEPEGNTINLKRFIKIVGEEYIQKFENFDNILGDHSEEFFMLYTLWREFKYPNENDSRNREPVESIRHYIDQPLKIEHEYKIDIEEGEPYQYLKSEDVTLDSVE